MYSESTAILSEAYQRLHRNGPEFSGDERGDNGLTNHGPMAAEVICRRGLEIDVHRWLDRYIRRLTELPATAEPITDATWRQALGGGQRRIGDWTAYFTRQLARAALALRARYLVATPAARHRRRVHPRRDPGEPRGPHPARGRADPAGYHRAWLRPGLLGRQVPRPARARRPLGCLPAATALAAVPRLSDQNGLIARRLDRLARLPGWPAAVGALRPPATAADVPARLAELVNAATTLYLTYSAASPVLLVHTATAPNGVLHTLPALPQALWAPSFTAAWTAAAALTAAYAPAGPSEHPRQQALGGTDPASDVLAQAARHGDEHVLKFTDTAVDVYRRTGHADALAAAQHAARLIDPP